MITITEYVNYGWIVAGETALATDSLESDVVVGVRAFHRVVFFFVCPIEED